MRPGTSHRFGNDVIGFVLGNRLALGIDFGKKLAEPFANLPATLSGDGGRLKRSDTNQFVF